MVKINVLRGKMVEVGINVPTLAEEIGVDTSTVYRWFSDPDNITVGAAKKIGSALHLESDTMQDIFFPISVA